MPVSNTKRLSKVAREFNVGISTIVEFLHKKGFQIDGNPNAKVSTECYSALVQEYSKDIEIKKEKEKVTQRTLKARKEVVTLDDIEDEEETTDSDEVILIKDTSGVSITDDIPAKKEKPKKEKKVEPEKAETEKVELKEVETEKVEVKKIETEKKEPEIKIVGKIELEKKVKKKKEESKVEEQPLKEEKTKVEQTKEIEPKEENIVVNEEILEAEEIEILGPVRAVGGVSLLPLLKQQCLVEVLAHGVSVIPLCGEAHLT